MINSFFLRHKDQDSVINLKNMLVDIAEAQVQLLTYKSGIQITNREIGEVVFSILPVLSPNFMELDGRTISESAYPNFFKHLRLLKAKYPEYFCGAEEYAAYMSEHHICPLFFLDEENQTCRIPKVSGLIEAQGLTAHGFFPYNTISEESVPNLKGDFGSVTGANSSRITYANTHTGVFSKTETRNTKYYTSRTQGDATDNSWGATFDASAYDKRYKDDSKVHPKTTVLKCYMIVGRDSSYPHIVYSWHDDQNSVRVYSDGYCQQEGIIGPEGTQKTVSFNYPLVSNVNVQLTPYRLGSDQSGSSFLITEMTNTSFSMNKEQDASFKFSVTGYVDLSIIPTEVDYRAQSTDVLEMMEYEKEIKTKLSKTVLVSEMPPEEERDPEAMYIVVNPENIKVVQDVTNVFYGSSEKENYSGELQTSFYHSGEYTEQEETQTEDATVNVSADNPEQIIEFNDFNELPEVSEVPDHVKVTSISKNQVKVNYVPDFVPETHEDSKVISSERTDTENGEHFEGTYGFTLYHSGESQLNVEEKSETFEIASLDEDYTLEFVNTYDSVPTITPSEESEVQIISISTTGAVIRGQGSVTVTGTVTTRTFNTETKSDTLTRTLAFGKEYEEPVITIPEDASYAVELSEDKKYCTITVNVEKSIEYGTPEVIEGTYSVDVHEGKVQEPDPVDPDPSDPTDPEPSEPEPETPQDPSENQGSEDPNNENPSKGPSKETKSYINSSADTITLDEKEASETFTVESNADYDVNVTNKGKINLTRDGDKFTVQGNFDGTSEIILTSKDNKEISKTITVTVSNCTDTAGETKSWDTFPLSIKVEHPQESENTLKEASVSISLNEKDTTMNLQPYICAPEEPISVIKKFYIRAHGASSDVSRPEIANVVFNAGTFKIIPKSYTSSKVFNVDCDVDYLTPSIKEPYEFTEEETITPHTYKLGKRYTDISSVNITAYDALVRSNGSLDEPSTISFSRSGNSTVRTEITHLCDFNLRSSSSKITCHKWDFDPDTNQLTVWVGVPGGKVMAGAPIVLSQTAKVNVVGTLAEDQTIPDLGATLDADQSVLNLDGISESQIICVHSDYVYGACSTQSKYAIVEPIFSYVHGNDRYDYYRVYGYKNTEGVDDNFITFGVRAFKYSTNVRVNVTNAPVNPDTLEWTITADSGKSIVSNGKVQYPVLPIFLKSGLTKANINPDDYEVYLNGELHTLKINQLESLSMNKGDVVTVKRISDQAGWFAPYTFKGMGKDNTNHNSYVKILSKELPVFTTDGYKPSHSANGMFMWNFNMDDVDVDNLFNKFPEDTTFAATFQQTNLSRLMDISRFTKTRNLNSMYRNTPLTLSDDDAHYFDHIEVPVSLKYIFGECGGITRIPEGMLDNPNIVSIDHIMYRGIGGQEKELDISTIPERFGLTLEDIS